MSTNKAKRSPELKTNVERNWLRLLATMMMLLLALGLSASATLAKMLTETAAGAAATGAAADQLHPPTANNSSTEELAWRVVSSPNVGAGANLLEDVSASSANDAWAVGYYYNASNIAQTLIMRWNGNQWSVVPSPNVGTGNNTLIGVSAVSSGEVWAVGTYLNAGNIAQTLIMRWNGNQWSVVPSPNIGTRGNYLSDISMLPANTGWAVGYWHNSTGQEESLALRWNGSEWSSITLPPGRLQAVSATSSNDAWALKGNQVLRWNGQAWNHAFTLTTGSFSGIDALSGSDVWVVGSTPCSPGDCYGTAPLKVHWNGSSWTVYDSFCCLSSLVYSSNAWDVSITSAINAWVIYYVSYCDEAYPYECGRYAGAARWDGSDWQGATVPYGVYKGIRSLSANNVWAVGSLNDRTRIVRYSDPSTFADVPQGSTFYPFVSCLANRDIDTGYACGEAGEPCNASGDRYFRPNSLIKRDNLAHMVAASAGFSEDPGARRFQDVPSTNPYYVWVQRMANRGLIGGYPCGGVGEPCIAPNNLAYYRPNANATRGQIAKIVSNGAGFNEPPTGQLFEDVAPSHPFYDWVQRLVNRGVIGGYPCGGVGEPCGAGNRPYFRWGNDATRGQVSKIVANTFFPGCQP